VKVEIFGGHANHAPNTGSASGHREVIYPESLVNVEILGGVASHAENDAGSTNL
jgi:hypothetical protein